MGRYDLLVIGSGPAGQSAAIQAAKLCRKVALIERGHMVGGVCLHTGTIPSKTLRAAVLYLTGWDQRGVYGIGYRLKRDLSIEDLMQRLEITITQEIEMMGARLAQAGVTVIEGSASFIDEHRLLVTGTDGDRQELVGDYILIATGTYPAHPEGIPFDGEAILDSDMILRLKQLPRSMTVVGAGVIGVEYASIFSTLDCKVTLVDGRPSLLPFLDREMVDEFVHYLRDNGMILRLGEDVEGIERQEDGKVLTRLKSGKRLLSDVVLFAAGRRGSTGDLNLGKVGLSADVRSLIEVNDRFQTSVPHIYAAGDVVGFPSLASTSMDQGRQVACHAFGQPATSRPEHFPFAVYAVPEMSMVGMTEQELTEKRIPYIAGIARLRDTARGQITGLKKGFLKILFDAGDYRVLGVHILGESASELIHIGQAVLVLGGGMDFFLENIFNYPTLAEAYKLAALDAWNQVSANLCPLPAVGVSS